MDAQRGVADVVSVRDKHQSTSVQLGLQTVLCRGHGRSLKTLITIGLGLILLTQLLQQKHGFAHAKVLRQRAQGSPRHYLPGWIDRADQDVADYDTCRKKLRHPNWSPLTDEWDCERLYFPLRPMIHTVREVKAQLLFELIAPNRYIDSENNTANITLTGGPEDENFARSFIEEELLIHDNMDDLILVLKDMRKRRSWDTQSEIYPWIRDIRDLWGSCCKNICDSMWYKCDRPLTDYPRQQWSYLEYQRLKYTGIYNETGMALVTRRSQRVANNLDELVTAFRAQPPVWSTLPATMKICPSPDLAHLRDRRILALLGQVCHKYEVADQHRSCSGHDVDKIDHQGSTPDCFYHGAAGPVIFRQLVAPQGVEVSPYFRAWVMADPQGDVMGTLSYWERTSGRPVETDPVLLLTAS
ncbi:uncharacterized protein B0I36DRAFT_330940 [Microdochium trichocladiopsis]|uniref:Uncharacterized protein n=1 Tax=Microdochium trichocladiopsis TaxID=1682393 RepID=A0A9P8XZI2_9PEZI|nr:uncharacterized protein B0I36DRAFT_330940 [Microdochium trichocladiopsis]KAH7026580.1 hypothetical protein B0I36DRAFT_330940 [Microdochium trichocladiopsis]